MKIVDVAEFYAVRGGGVKTYIDQKFAAAHRHGVTMVVVAPGPDDRVEQRPGGKLIWVESPKLRLDPRYHKFRSEDRIHAILDQEQPDLVEASSPWKGGRIVARWQGPAAKVMFWHQEPVSAYPQALMGRTLGRDRVDRLFGWYWAYLRHLARGFDHAVVSSQWMADRLSRFGLPTPMVTPLGVEDGLFSADARDPALRARLLSDCGIGEDGALLLEVTRFHPEKSVGTVIDAAARANRARPVGLILVGDGPLAGWVRRKAQRAGNVHLAGVISDRRELARIMASSDAFLHGGGAEPFGLVVAEAVCSGLPLVVPDSGGASELARPAYAEFYESGSSHSASAAILRLLERNLKVDFEARRQDVPDGVGSIERHFARLFAGYEKLISGPAATPHHPTSTDATPAKD